MAEHSSDWLYCVSISSLGLKLADSELRVICATRLGSPLCIQHTCICGAEVEPTGRHCISCKTFIKSIDQKIKNLTGNKKSKFYLFQSISMAVQRGNTASILATVKPG